MFLKLVKSLPVLIGAYTLTSNGYNNLRDAYHHFYRAPTNILKTYGNKGYFIITEAEDGLGKAFAREMAVKGLPLILIGKNEDSLKRVKNDLTKEFSAKIELIFFNFDTFSLENYEFLLNQLNNYEISGLINNTGSLIAKDLGKMSHEELLKSIRLNILPNVLLTKYAIDRFSQRSSEYKSLISTTSSALGAYPHPHLALYAASKAYNSSFIKSVIGEKPKNTDIHLLEPGLISNENIYERSFPREWEESNRWKWMISESDEVAEESVRRFGNEKIIYGTFRHWVYHSLLRNCRNAINYTYEGSFYNI